jgi:hypothetical protein
MVKIIGSITDETDNGKERKERLEILLIVAKAKIQAYRMR